MMNGFGCHVKIHQSSLLIHHSPYNLIKKDLFIKIKFVHLHPQIGDIVLF